MKTLEKVIDFDKEYYERKDGYWPVNVRSDYVLSESLTELLYKTVKDSEDILVFAFDDCYEVNAEALTRIKSMMVESDHLARMMLKIYDYPEFTDLREGVRYILLHETGHLRNPAGKELYAATYALSKLDDPINGLAAYYAIVSYLLEEDQNCLIDKDMNGYLNCYETNARLKGGFPLKSSAIKEIVKKSYMLLNELRKHSKLLPVAEGRC